MKIADNVDVHLEICDIETLVNFTDIGCYNPDTGTWLEFEISKWKNDLYKFVKWYTSKPCDYLVTFNGVNFDQQVLQYIVDNYDKWYDLTGEEVAGKIYEYVQRIIDLQNYGIPVQYHEDKFPIHALDLFKIHHFDNEARRTSLKWCAFMMDMDVEEMPIHHSSRIDTREDADLVISYRRNDCRVTHGLLYITLGLVDKVLELSPNASISALKDYRGKNKIQDRFDVMRETGLKCLNWSDVKIGEEWNKLDYMKEMDIKSEWDLKPAKVKQPYGQKFKKYFPDTVEFQTDELKKFAKEFGDTTILAKKQEFRLTFFGTTYTIAKGGIHSCESHRAVVTPQGYKTRDADVGSQYPWFIYKTKVHGTHLDPVIVAQLGQKISRRIDLKARAKKLKASGDDVNSRLCMSVQEMLKLCLNGGYYGKLNQNGSFLQYPEGTLKVTIGCQMEILMLIEMLELGGIHVISGNTDGVVASFPESLEPAYDKICDEWEKKVGNNTIMGGKLEYVDFEAIWQESINHYIGKKVDGGVKKKGRFMTEFDLNKNKSKRIIPLALEQYFIYGKDPVDFIKNHQNIFDFCIAKKAYENLHYEELKYEEPTIHKKLIRYFVSTDGYVFMKRGLDSEGDPMNNHCEATDKDFPWVGQPLLTYFNKSYIKPIADYKINYNYYILETLKRIDNIEKTKKARSFAEKLKPNQQSSLF